MPNPSPRPVAYRRVGGLRSALRRGTVGLLAVAAACLAMAPAGAVTIEWVTVGDPGNAADTSGYGAVAEQFRIMKYEFTNSQYVEFLNSVDPNGTNPYSVYHKFMGDNLDEIATPFAQSGIRFNAGNATGSKYSLRPDMGNKPVNFVSWFDAARVANWLHNGQGSGSTESGAYTLVGGQTNGLVPARNPSATYYIPTENQWYKAAYYAGGGTNSGYWRYATRANSDPSAVGANSVGDGAAGSSGNSANYYGVAQWNKQPWGFPENVTTVGTNGGPSVYGTFDMGGNVAEWNDLAGAAGLTRGVRGGALNYFGANFVSSSFREEYSLTGPPGGWRNVLEWFDFGFRLASLPALTVTGSQVYSAPVTGIVTTGSGAPQFNSGFTGSLTVTGGTATLGGSIAGTVTVGAGAAATIASGASLTNAKVSLAPGAILAVARGTSVPIAAGNIGGITVSTTSGLAVQVLAGTVAADTTIFTNTSPKGNFNAVGGSLLVGDVLTFQGTGSATWVLQMQYDPTTLPDAEAAMASAGKLFLTWRNPGSNAWVNAVDGNTGGTKQLFQRAWQAGDALGSYGVDVTTDTVWAVINHNSDFAITAVPEPTTLALAAGGFTAAAWDARRRSRRRRAGVTSAGR